MLQPRAADDFAAIRARTEELRREREQIAVGSVTTTPGARPGTYASGSRSRYGDRPDLSPAIKRIVVDIDKQQPIRRRVLLVEMSPRSCFARKIAIDGHKIAANFWHRPAPRTLSDITEQQSISD